jgi:hypothetical protein
MNANVSKKPPAVPRPRLTLVQSHSRLPETNDALERLIPEEDAKGLPQYFAGGADVFCRSSFGVVISRLADYYPWVECWRCRGTGFVSTTGKPRKLDADARWQLQVPVRARRRVLRDVICPVCNGRGRYDPVRKCGCCHGSGWDAESGQFCEVCNSIGWVMHLHRVRGASPERVTAWPTNSSVPLVPLMTIEPEVAANLGSLCRRLAALAVLDQRARDVLEAFWGPDGDHWRTSCAEGRIFAVYPLTPPAKKLLKSHPTRDDLPAHVVLGTIAEAQRQQPNPLRARLLQGAHDQAVELYRVAAALWCKLSAASPKPQQKRPAPAESVKTEGS